MRLNVSLNELIMLYGAFADAVVCVLCTDIYVVTAALQIRG